MALQSALITLAAARPALAFPTTRLVYVRAPGAETCPDQDAVRNAVRARLGYDPFFPTSDKAIVLRISRAGQQLKGEVHLVNEQGVEIGEREFASNLNKCDELVLALALSISIAIDPKSAETYAQSPTEEAALDVEPKQNELPPKPQLAAVPVPAQPTTPESPAAATYSTRIHWLAGIGLTSLFGIAPGPAVGGLGFVASRASSWSLALEGYAALPVAAQYGDVRLRTTSYGLSVLPCLHFGVGFACERTALGALQATGTGVNGKTGTSLTVSFGARLGVELPLTAVLGIVAQGDVLVNPWAERVLSAGRPLWTAPALGGDLGIAVALHFR